MTRALWIGVLCASVAVGCSLPGVDDDEEETKAGKTNDQNAKSNAQQQTTAITTAMEGNAQSSADALFQAGSGSQGTITAQSFDFDLRPSTIRPLEDSTGPGCSCTAKSCTFTNCERNSGGKVKLNGTLSAENDTFKCDLTWETDGTQGGLGSITKIHVKADMTTTATSIKGTLHTDGSVETKGLEVNIPGVPANAGNTSWVNDAKWDVQVANKQPTGGSIEYSGNYKVGDTTYTGSGKVTFP